MKQNFQSYRNSFLLFLAAFIWGVAFVAQSVGMEYMGPFTFNGTRCLIGGCVLLPLIAWRSRCGEAKKEAEASSDRAAAVRTTLAGGICCGLALGVASMLQQIGIMYTSVGKAGFITTLYIILVPILGLFLRKRVRRIVWFAAVLAAAGMYLLCMTESMTLGKGDFLVLLCAVAFSVHILVIDYFSPKADGVKLSCIQFYVAGILCAIGAFIWEEPSLSALIGGALPLLYAGVLSCGVAYTLQIIGQKGLDPTVAALILSMESVISVIAGWVLLGQSLSARELAGCVLVLAAVIWVQLPEKEAGEEPGKRAGGTEGKSCR